MRTSILLAALGLSVAPLACGGNVNVGSKGAGGGATTSTTTTGTSTTTTTTVTSTSTSSTTATEDFAACTGSGQCTLAPKSCCGVCGSASLGDLAAVNSAKLGAFHAYVCPNPQACPNCAQMPNPNLFAYCNASECVAADVRTDPVSACAVDADCTLRAGSACCEACGDLTLGQIVAVSSKASPNLAGLVCGPDSGCPGCIANMPQGATAKCAAGHCAVVAGGMGGP